MPTNKAGRRYAQAIHGGKKYYGDWPSNKRKFYLYLDDELKEVLNDMSARLTDGNRSKMARLALRAGLLKLREREIEKMENRAAEVADNAD